MSSWPIFLCSRTCSPISVVAHSRRHYEVKQELLEAAVHEALAKRTGGAEPAGETTAAAMEGFPNDPELTALVVAELQRGRRARLRLSLALPSILLPPTLPFPWRQSRGAATPRLFYLPCPTPSTQQVSASCRAGTRSMRQHM